MSLSNNIIMKYKGIWFYGLSGSGKTLLSNTIKKKFKKIFIIDGDKVRKNISFDLSYSQKDRDIQVKRIFGLCKNVLESNMIPVASTVNFNKEILKLCKKENILPIKIIRKNMLKIFKKHKTYKNKKNVFGLDLKYDNFKTLKITNNNNKTFCQNLSFFEKFLIVKSI